MNQSPEINELAAALAKAQGAFTNPARNREVEVTMKAGGKYKFAYATLSGIMDMIRKPMADNGLYIGHSLGEDDKGAICETRVIHNSGQWISCWVPVIVAPEANAQGWGAAITYAKRYGICTLLAVTADEDDDGNAGCANEAVGADRAAGGRNPKGKANGKPPAKSEPEPAKTPPASKFWHDMDATEQGKFHSWMMNRAADAKDNDARAAIVREALQWKMRGEALAELSNKVCAAITDPALVTKIGDTMAKIDQTEREPVPA